MGLNDSYSFENRGGGNRRRRSALVAKARKTNDILQERLELERLNEEASRGNADMDAMFVSEMNKRRESNKDHTVEKVANRKNYIQEAAHEVGAYTFAHIVYDAYPLDEDIKSHPTNTQMIYEKAIDVYKNNVSSITFSPYFQNVEDNATTMLDKEPIDGVIPKEKCAEVVSKLSTGDVTQKYVTTLINKNVISAIKDESLISKMANKSKEEGTYVTESETLYRTLFLSSLKQVMNESDLTDQDEINNHANNNAVLDLTILEALHTTKLIDMNDPAKLRKMVRMNQRKLMNS